MPQVRRTAEARLDYLNIFVFVVFVGEENLKAADKLVQTFDDKLNLLADMPGLGPARAELGKGIRSFPVGNYLLLYRPTDDGIELLRILHGARNLKKIFRKR